MAVQSKRLHSARDNSCDTTPPRSCLAGSTSAVINTDGTAPNGCEGCLPPSSDKGRRGRGGGGWRVHLEPKDGTREAESEDLSWVANLNFDL